MASQEGKKMYKILNPDQDVEGKSISEWTAEWWKWVGERSADQSPLDDPTGKYASLGNDGEVFFVAGPRVVTIDQGSDPPVVDDSIVTRKFNVPFDTPLLVPVINVLSFDPTKDPGEGKKDYDPLSYYMDRFEGLYATIDGEKIEGIKDNYQVASPDFQLGPADEGTVLYDDLIMADKTYAGDPTVTYDVKADGYYLMVGELSRGKHTLEFGGFFDSEKDGDFDSEQDVYMAVKDIITVAGPSDYTCPSDAETLPEAEMLIA
jgi:hypothetical protein